MLIWAPYKPGASFNFCIDSQFFEDIMALTPEILNFGHQLQVCPMYMLHFHIICCLL